MKNWLYFRPIQLVIHPISYFSNMPDMAHKTWPPTSCLTVFPTNVALAYKVKDKHKHNLPVGRYVLDAHDYKFVSFYSVPLAA